MEGYQSSRSAYGFHFSSLSSDFPALPCLSGVPRIYRVDACVGEVVDVSSR
ncbi:MAG: hypothetical protein QG597_1669, partial [Actinomycetota bacterium]|nr:hypothetical protein [Actinomycetota bacterium]